MTTYKKARRGLEPAQARSDREALLARLRSRDGSVRQKARQALTSLGPRAVPQLIPLLKEPKDDVRWEAAKPLGDIGDARAAATLVTALEDENTGVRWLAAVGLIAIGRGALRPLLEGLIKRADSVWLRDGAHNVLTHLANGDLKDVLSPVVAALDSINPEVGLRKPASAALQAIGSAGGRSRKRASTPRSRRASPGTS